MTSSKLCRGKGVLSPPTGSKNTFSVLIYDNRKYTVNKVCVNNIIVFFISLADRLHHRPFFLINMDNNFLTKIFGIAGLNEIFIFEISLLKQQGLAFTKTK